MEVAATTIQAWASHLRVDPQSVDAVALRSELSEGTIPEVFARTASEHPEATVAVGDETLTQQQRRQRVAQAASVLAGAGAARGTRILICAHSSMSFVTCYLAALWTGATVILANPGYSDAELDKLVDAAKPALLLAEISPMMWRFLPSPRAPPAPPKGCHSPTQTCSPRSAAPCGPGNSHPKTPSSIHSRSFINTDSVDCTPAPAAIPCNAVNAVHEVDNVYAPSIAIPPIADHHRLLSAITGAIKVPVMPITSCGAALTRTGSPRESSSQPRAAAMKQIAATTSNKEASLPPKAAPTTPNTSRSDIRVACDLNRA